MINKVTLLGRVGKKEVKPLKNGGTMCMLSIATSKKYLDSSGQKQDQTTWHNVSLFNKVAEIAEKYVEVGNLLYLEGEISSRRVTNPDGTEKWLYGINGNEIKLLPNSKNSAGDDEKDTKKPFATSHKPRAAEPDDDIPF